MSNPYPHELMVAGVCFSPLMPVLVTAFFAAVVTVFLLNKTKLARWFYAPSYVFAAIMVLFVILIDRFWIRF